MQTIEQKVNDSALKKLNAAKLFGESNIWKTTFQLAFTGFLISLMSGVYVFVDQLLIAKFVPTDGLHDIDKLLPGINLDKVQSEINVWNAAHPDSTLKYMDSAAIVQSALALTNFITLIFNALPLLVSVGAGVLFAQAISRRDNKKALRIYKTSFYNALCIGIFFATIFSVFTRQILSLSQGEHNQEYNSILNQYFDAIRIKQLDFATDFSRMMAIGTFFNTMTMYYAFMIRAEGRNAFVTIAALICNFINITIDFVLIYYCKQGMRSAGIATTCAWVLNFAAYQIYILLLVKKDQTLLNVKKVLPRNDVKFSWAILGPIFVLGFAAFARNFVNSFSNGVFTKTLGDVGGQQFQSLTGVVLPIHNLFFYAMFGIADGVRPMVAYCYAKNDLSRVKQSYWIIILVSILYGLFEIALLYSPIGQELVKLFNVTADRMPDALRYLNAQCFCTLFVSVSLGALMLFQATNNIIQAFIASIMQGGIVIWPVLFTLKYLAIINNNPWYVVYNFPINTAIASTIIFVWAWIFVAKFLGKQHLKIGDKKLVIPVATPKLSYAQRQLIK